MSGEESIKPLSESAKKTFGIIGRQLGAAALFSPYHRGLIQTAMAAEEEQIKEQQRGKQTEEQRIAELIQASELMRWANSKSTIDTMINLIEETKPALE